MLKQDKGATLISGTEQKHVTNVRLVMSVIEHVKGRDGGLKGGEQSFLNLIALANRNKCEIKTIGLAKTTPLYRSSQAPYKDPNYATKVPGQLELTYPILGARSHKPMPLVFYTLGSSYTILVSKNTKLLSSLAMLNNKATNAKLESVNIQLHKLSNVTNKVTQTKLAT